MSKKHNNRNRRQSMANVNNVLDGPNSKNDSLQIEASMPAPHSLNETPTDTNEEPIAQMEVSADGCENNVNSNKALFERINRLRDSLSTLRSEEEYSFYESSLEYLSDIKKKYNNIQTLIQKANISFEKFNYNISTIISESKIFEKNFDVLCLFKSPDISNEAKDWFVSLTRALDLMEKALKGETDEKLGRIPPANFRACIKNSSQYDPIYTMSVSTPIYRVKADSCSDEFFPIAWKGANSFSLYSKYLLNTEQKLKTVLLTVLPESDIDKAINADCLPPTIEGDKDPITFISELESKLDAIELDIKCDTFESLEELDFIESFISNFPVKLTEINNLLYESKERVKDSLTSVEKQFYKTGLSDLFKMYNDISKLILSFEKTDAATLRGEDSQSWHNILLDLKLKTTDYLNRLGIYENETVIENATIWNENMDFIEILEGEEDNSKPEGQISKVNSIGFYYMQASGKKDYIEKTKVFVYRKS